jgi:hypothetical protein
MVPFRRFKRLPLAANGEMSISAAMGQARPEMSSSFDSLTSILNTSAVGIYRVSLIVRLFRLPLKVPSEKLWEGIVPREYFSR